MKSPPKLADKSASMSSLKNASELATLELKGLKGKMMEPAELDELGYSSIMCVYTKHK